jgi:hypothetical protein
MMKKITYTLICLFLLMVKFIEAKDIYVSTSFHEPANEGLRFIYSEDGIHWDSIPGTFLRPMVGKEKVMRDPSVVKGPDDIFHLVWTSSWKGDRGFGYASSKDLIHWSKEKFIEVMDDTTTVNVWAPEIFYDDIKQQYLIVWSSCVPGKFPDGIEEHTNNQRLYYTTTKDFKKFEPTKLFYNPGYSCIDATLIKRGKDDYAMIVKDNSRNERDIKVAFAKSPYGPWSETAKAFTEQFSEGPTTAKVGDWYYIYYDSYRKFIFGAAKTKDFIHFQNATGAVKIPVGHKHGTIFMVDEKLVRNLLKENCDAVHYTGKAIATPERHDGGLAPVVGVHNIQMMRAEKGWTYNHQPMMAYWHCKFWVHYLSDPRSEHEPPGKTMLMTSADGYQWTQPVELFPPYNVPDGYTKSTVPNVVAKNMKAVMHQRVGFYLSKTGRLIAIGNYGVALTPTDDPNDGNGIGRVVREIKDNGTFGGIFFIYYNHGFNASNTDYPYYKKAKDKQFVKACDELISNPLCRMQWVEEADREDPFIPLTTPYKAFCDYTLPDGRKVALWKHALTSISNDGGATWHEPVVRAHGFVTSNAKIWGQRLSDGSYATVYNPAEYRWPLSISLSGDGLEYTTLNLVNGEVTPERHGGNYKNYGPQYTRGIQEGNGIPKDKNLWVTYSMNKEDMWVSRIKVPIRIAATEQADEEFSKYHSLADMDDWNIHSPLFAPVSLDGKWLKMSDKDPYDYAKVEKIIPKTKELKVDFDVKSAQNDHGTLDIEFLDNHGTVCSRIVFDSTAAILAKGGARYGTILKHYDTEKSYHISALLSADMHKATYFINGKMAGERMFDTPIEAITRIVFRTGSTFAEPTIETPAEQHFDLPKADDTDPLATFYIANVKSVSLDNDGSAALLHYEDYAHYAQKFNAMEDENIVTDIPNSQSSEWMRRNIPLFDCPQQDFEEMYYYRWWSLRKHIERTPVGYGMTEFLVPRTYADKYNLIACAIGHHVMESRWMRDTTYLKQILRTWYYGNDGHAMDKMNKFSSWNPAAIYEAYKVTGDTAFLLNLKPELEKEYARWKRSNRLKNGLYWQGDVQDGMEESISGGRKKQYARPTINSYMYGNARALAVMNALSGDTCKAKEYTLEADTIRNLVENKLWNSHQHFFETMKGDTLANVREAIGYIPWYFNLPSARKYDLAWAEVNDTKGFSAPYGLTTAEQRHPQFRSHGTGTCEWDGAIWPFATSQTLTAMANYINNYSNPSISDTTFFREMKLYIQSQHHRGLPYIGEYLDEKNGTWLMGDRERSRYYNHSTFADLVISGLVGLRPQADGSIVIHPLVPKDTWRYFCLDNVYYHGHNICIIWDKDGQRYHQGTGFMLFINGKLVAKNQNLEEIIWEK